MNYIDVVIYADEEVSFSSNTDLCDCEKSVFFDPYHDHIITGGLGIIENSKLQKLLIVGPLEALKLMETKSNKRCKY